MPLESGTTLSDLDKLWPLGGDPLSQGDDHLRLIKSILKTQFPGSLGQGYNVPITATEEQLNNLGDLDVSGKVSKTGDTMTGQLIIDLVGSVKNALSMLNNVGGLELVLQSNGEVELVSTNSSGGGDQREIVIDPSSDTRILVGGNEKLKATTGGGSLSNNWTAVTQSEGNDSTRIATTAFVQDTVAAAALGYRYASLWTGHNTSGTFALSEPITNFDCVTFIAGQSGYAQHHAVAVESIQIGTSLMSACTRLGSSSNGGLIIKFPDANNVQITASVEGQALQAVYGQKY